MSLGLFRSTGSNFRNILTRYFYNSLTRKAHKNTVFIINPLSAKSIWVKVEFRVKAKFWVKVKFRVKVQGQVQGRGQGVCGCIWLRQMSGDNTDGASSGLIR